MGKTEQQAGVDDGAAVVAERVRSVLEVEAARLGDER